MRKKLGYREQTEIKQAQKLLSDYYEQRRITAIRGSDVTK